MRLQTLLKTTFITILAFLSISSLTFGASNLWGFYQETGLKFPTFEERKNLYETQIDNQNYYGTSEQNKTYLEYLNSKLGMKLGATILYPSGGGTGTSTAPSYGQMLVGNSGGTYTLTATSSLGISGTGSGASPDWVKQTNYGVLTLTASTTIPVWFKDIIYASSTIISSGTGTSTFAGAVQIGNNYIATTTTVCAWGCDFSDINTAVDTVVASSTILIKNGIYALGTGTITVAGGKSLNIQGESMDGVIITYSGGGAAFTIGDSTTVTRNFRMENISIKGTSSGTRGFSFTNVRNSYINNLKSTGFSSAVNPGQAFRLDGTGGYTGDNDFFNLNCDTSEFCVNLSGTAVNSNHFFGFTLRTTGTAASRAVNLANANGNTFFGGLVSAGQGFDFNSTGDENLVSGTYCEANTTCVNFDSGASDNNVTVIDVESNTTVVADAGNRNTWSYSGSDSLGKSQQGMATSTFLGFVGIGTTTPNWLLSVAGIGSFDDFVRSSYFTATSTATSTFVGGIDAARICITGTTNCLGATGATISADWNKQTNFGALSLTPTTTIPIWSKSNIYASSTIQATNFVADSTTATSTLQKTSITGAISLLGEYFENFTTYVRSLFTAGNGLSVSSGQYSINSTGLVNNAPITWNGTNLTATGTPNFTSGYFTATSTSKTATSTFSSYVNLDTTTNTANCYGINGKCATPRWISPYHGGGAIAVTSATTTAGTTINMEFESLWNMPVDQICYQTASATTTAPNIIVGLYGPIPTEETILSAPLLATSGTTTGSLLAASAQCVSFTAPAQLGVGRYYMSFLSPEGASFMRQGNQTQVTGWIQTFTGTGGDLPLTAPTPTNTGSNGMGMKLRGVKPN